MEVTAPTVSIVSSVMVNVTMLMVDMLKKKNSAWERWHSQRILTKYWLVVAVVVVSNTVWMSVCVCVCRVANAFPGGYSKDTAA